MARLTPARAAALSCLSERRRRNGRIREILRASSAVAALGAQDRALASRLAIGCVATQGLLDEVLNERLRRPSSVEPRVRDALRLAAFEICYLATPTSAGVSQGVEAVRSVSSRAAGMANAVLRRLASEVRPQIEAARTRCVALHAGDDCDCFDLPLVSGLPTWLVRRVVATRGDEAARALCLAQLEPAPTYAALNLLLLDTAQGEALLVDGGFAPEATGLPASYRLGRPAGLHDSDLVRSSRLVVSDLAAQMVARIAAPMTGGRVLEIGQGRGTKTLLMASAAAGADARFVGVESVASKQRLCTDRLDTAGLTAAASLEIDGRRLADADLPPVLDRRFDVVLLDAPCSGTGTMRRHPEIPWALCEVDVEAGGTLPTLQSELLTAASSQVRPGGLLAYATCSILPEEDERVVEAFLERDAGSDFERVSVLEAPGIAALSDEARAIVARCVRDDGSFLSLPAQDAPDGHFCTLLRRRS